MKTLNRRGTRKPYANSSGATISVDSMVGPFGTANRFGIAINDIANGDTGVVETGGEHEYAKAAVAWSDGDLLYYDATADVLTNTANTGANMQCGFAVGDAVAGNATGFCQLNNQPAVGGDGD